MSFVKLWVHLVFSTKNREPNLTTEIRRRLIEHIKANAREKGIYVDEINGWSEHLHLLISIGKEQSIAKIAMLVKGESAHWLNEQQIIRGKFYWQDDYYAVSVSPSKYEEVKEYIKNQEQRHTVKPFTSEAAAFSKITSF